MNFPCETCKKKDHPKIPDLSSDGVRKHHAQVDGVPPPFGILSFPSGCLRIGHLPKFDGKTPFSSIFRTNFAIFVILSGHAACPSFGQTSMVDWVFRILASNRPRAIELDDQAGHDSLTYQKSPLMP